MIRLGFLTKILSKMIVACRTTISSKVGGPGHFQVVRGDLVTLKFYPWYLLHYMHANTCICNSNNTLYFMESYIWVTAGIFLQKNPSPFSSYINLSPVSVKLSFKFICCKGICVDNGWNVQASSFLLNSQQCISKLHCYFFSNILAFPELNLSFRFLNTKYG